MTTDSRRQYAHGTPAVAGVLFCNLGTPDEPTPGAVRRYLREFLWDRRVVDVPRPLWWLVLNGFILPFRPRKVAHAYQTIWTNDGSPLRAISERQASALQDAFDASHPGRVKVVLAMRYGNPSIAAGLKELAAAGVRDMFVLPAYPQYSCSTTASVFDSVAEALKATRWVPGLSFLRNYHDRPAYITALADSVREHWAKHGRADRMLMSFHGVPKRYLLEGDPYHCECRKTARLLAEALDLTDGQWAVTFQSRFGREEWLKPYTDKTLEHWGADGVSSVDVVCPGFSADCLETLEEIAIQNRALFIESGGKALRYVPALNDRAAHIALLHELAVEQMQPWLARSPDSESELATTRDRARALGAES